MASGFWNVNESAANVGRAQDRQARTEAARKQAAAAKAAQRGGKRI